MKNKTFIALSLIAFLAGCNSNPAAHDAAKSNVVAIGSLRLGQSPNDVQRIMGKPPESTTYQMTENNQQETHWYYLTNYHDEINTELTFLNNKLVAIRGTKWLGDGQFMPRSGR